jgi:hypothetical protein
MFAASERIWVDVRGGQHKGSQGYLLGFVKAGPHYPTLAILISSGRLIEVALTDMEVRLG